MNKLKRLALRFRGRPLRLMLLPWFMWWLPGCAVNDYALYSNANVTIAKAKYDSDATQAEAWAKVEIARLEALERIARGSTDPTVQAVSAMAAQFRAQQQQQSTSAPAPQLAAPAPMGETAWRAAGLIIPGLTQMYGLRKQAETAAVQASYAFKTEESRNATYLGIAGKIPVTNTTILSGQGTIGNNGTYTDNKPNTTTLSGQGTIGNNGAYTDSKPITTTDSHQVTDSHPVTTTDSHPVTTTTSNDSHPITSTTTTTPATSTTTATATASTVFTPWVTP